MKNITVCIKGEHPTLKFAAEELIKYLSMMSSDICVKQSFDECGENTIILDLLDETSFDIDTVSVNIKGLCGTIKGSNPRSVLYAVYKYLEKLGARWVRHGKDGEYIPKDHNFEKDVVEFCETAKYKHRCMCTEGALSFENLLDNIDWVAKMGFNEYYVQGILPEVNLKRWHSHIGNPLLPAEDISTERLCEIKKCLEKEIKKRDLIYYTVGHGWHSEPFGMTSLVETENENITVPEGVEELLAMLNGKRGIYNNSVAVTHLCYSNPRARKGIIDYAVQYCKDHPEMDYLLFPLADGANNHCECNECSKYRPSDLYVKLLNELDEVLTREGIPAKVAIAVYCDFLWAPTQGKFNNPDRFIYVYSPFHRTLYLHNPQIRNGSGAYKDIGRLFTTEELPKYERNKLKMPETSEELISFLRSWQEWQDVDAFAHEYYYYVGEHYFDFGSVYLARVIYDDIRELPKYKLNGMLTCQTQRAFLPTGIGSYVMAKALWNDEIPYEDMERDYFTASFGEKGEMFRKYFNYLSRLAHEKPNVPFDTVKETCNKMIEYINALDIDEMDECRRASIKYVLFHCNLLIRQMEAEKATYAYGDIDGAEKEWKELIHYARVNEMSVQPVFDLQLYFTHLGGRAFGKYSSHYGALSKWWQDWDESDK
ncbi:MAG: DUF4838 domain-containing protein [Ruminococcaceae bacterium]|nr:DUF4838 domain-containing protein [Oscillospiraceae bacterium]